MQRAGAWAVTKRLTVRALWMISRPGLAGIPCWVSLLFRHSRFEKRAVRGGPFGPKTLRPG